MQHGFSAMISKPFHYSHCAAMFESIMYEGKGEPPTLITYPLLRNRKENPDGKKPESAGFTGRRVLLAEDNAVNQLVVCSLLEKFSLDITTANNGRETLEYFRSDTYDLVLMDCQMPEIDGFEATREIRRLEAEKKLPHTPVIALTANVMKGDEEECLQAGMDGYIAKPIDQQKLEDILHSWLLRKSMAA